MNIIKPHFIKNWKYYIGTIFILLIIFLPFTQNGIFSCWDDSFHLYRIYSIGDALKNGIFPVKIHFIECYGYGYGVGLFYPNLLFYFPALLVAGGLSLATAYKVFAFFLLIAIFFTTYFSTWKITLHKDSAFTAAVIVILSSKMLNAFYMGMSLGIITGAIFMPLAIAGMYLLLTRNQSPYMLIIGFIGLIFSHTISTLFTVIICAILVLVYVKTLFQNKQKLLNIILSVGIVSSITATYWLSMLEQMRSQMFKISAPWTTSEQNVETFAKMIQRDGIGIMVLLVLFACIIVIILYCFNHKVYKLKQSGTGIITFLGIAIIFILLPNFYPFWHFMNTTMEINIIQFPYRLYVPATLLIAFSSAGILSLFNKNALKIKTAKMLFLLCIIASGLISSHILFSSNYLQKDSGVVKQIINGEIAGLGGGEEWLPISTNRDHMTTPEIATDNENNQIIGKKERGYSQFVFTADLSKEYYDIPYVYYKGYRAYTESGERLSIDQNYPTGLVRVFMPENGMGNQKITVKYEATKYQILADIISVVGIVFFVLYIINNKKAILFKKCLINRPNTVSSK